MSYHPQAAPVRPPSRRGTPSADGPIPFFGGQDASSSGAEFFSSMDGSMQHAAIQQTQLQQYGQQPYTAPFASHGVPPRSATAGPVEYQQYGQQADPYRSASVVYPGYGTQYGYEQNNAAPDGAAFFDQLAGASQQAAPADQNGYYAQYSQAAAQQPAYAGYAETADPAVSGATAQVQQAAAEPIYDEAMGQYYDPQSGQYYDNDSGTWYYPQAAAGYGTEYTQTTQEHNPPAVAAATAAGGGVLDATATAGYAQLAQPEVADGAAFFDNLGDADTDASAQHVDYSMGLPQQPVTTVPTVPVAAEAVGEAAVATHAESSIGVATQVAADSTADAVVDPTEAFDAIVSQSVQGPPVQVEAVSAAAPAPSALENVQQMTSDPADMFDAAVHQSMQTQPPATETVSAAEIPATVAPESALVETSDPADIFDAAISQPIHIQTAAAAAAATATAAEITPAAEIPAAVAAESALLETSDPAAIFDAAISESQPAQHIAEPHLEQAQQQQLPAVVPVVATEQVSPEPAGTLDLETVTAEQVHQAIEPAAIEREPVGVVDMQQVPSDPAEIFDAAISQPQPVAAEEPAPLQPADVPPPITHEDTLVTDAGQQASQLSRESTVEAELPISAASTEQSQSIAATEAVSEIAPPAALDFYTQLSDSAPETPAEIPVETQPSSVGEPAVSHETAWGTLTTQAEAFESEFGETGGQTGYVSFYQDQQSGAAAAVGVESLEQQKQEGFAGLALDDGVQQDLNAGHGAYDPYSSIGYSQAPVTSSGLEAVSDLANSVATGAVDSQQQQDPSAVYGAYDPYSTTGGYSQAPATSGGFETVGDLSSSMATGAIDSQQQQDPNAAYGAYDPYSTIGYSQVPDMAAERAVVDPTAAAVTGAVSNQQQQDANAAYGTYDPYSTGGYSQVPAGNGDYAVMDTGAATVGSTGDYQQAADMSQYETYDTYGSGGYSQAPMANGTDSLQQEQAGKVQQFDGSTGYTPFDPYSSGGYGQEDGGSGQQFGAYDPYSATGYSQAPVENGAATVAVVDTANGGESQQQQYSGYGGYDPYSSGGYSQAPVVNGVGDSSLAAPDKQMQVDSAGGYAAFDPYNAGGVSSPHGSAQMVTPQSFGYTGVPTAPAGVFDLQSQSERSSLDMAYERDLSAGDLAPAQVQDPLGRLQGRRPIIAFGFGGRLFTMFPRHVQRFNAHGGSAKTAPGMLRVQQLAEHVPPELSAQHEAAVFNTPLLGGETTKAALLKRRDVAVGCARAWLERMQGSDEERALVGVLAGVLEALGDNAQPEMARAGEALQPLFSVQEPAEPKGQESTEPIAHGSLADMQEIEGLLLAGRRSEAVALACQRGMWAHALVVASCTGKDVWQAVVAAYTASAMPGGLAPLGLQYRLFAGMGATAIEPPRPFDQRSEPQAGFVTAAELDTTPQASAPQGWAKTLALMLANRTPGDQTAMLQLGDRLRSDRQAVAAHICYALALQPKDVFLPDASGQARAVLLGQDASGALGRFSRFYRSQAAICLTELYEVAAAMRGSGDSPLCLPHLQAYKLYRAWWMADCGLTALALRYCDAVLGVLATLPAGVAVPFVHASLVQELRELRNRLIGSGMTSTKAAELVGDEAALQGKSWLARAMPRPSFTSLMSAFDSSIDKFITGADGHRIALDEGPAPGRFEIGPDRPGRSGPTHPGRPLGAIASRTPSPGVPQETGEPHIPMFATSPQAVPSRTSTDARRSLDHAAWGDPGTANLGSDGFIMPAAALGVPAPGFSAPPVHAAMSAPATTPPVEDEDEDMFGFSKKPVVKPEPVEQRSSAPPEPRKSTEAKPEAEASGVMGLFKSLWGGRRTQANLGDDSKFVYDPVLERWVDKNAKPEAEPPLPPPPPKAMGFVPQSASVPPPAQPATPVGPPLNSLPPGMGGRPASAVPPMAASAGTSRAGTPAGRRRGARSKYVDVLNQ